jgi:hypothetical protein
MKVTGARWWHYMAQRLNVFRLRRCYKVKDS